MRLYGKGGKVLSLHPNAPIPRFVESKKLRSQMIAGFKQRFAEEVLAE